MITKLVAAAAAAALGAGCAAPKLPVVLVHGACSAADQQALLASHKAEAVPPLGTPVKLSAERFGRVPRAYVHTRDDMAVSFGLQQAMLAAAGGADPVITLHTSHMPMLTQPKLLADAIAAAATTPLPPRP